MLKIAFTSIQTVSAMVLMAVSPSLATEMSKMVKESSKAVELREVRI